MGAPFGCEGREISHNCPCALVPVRAARIPQRGVLAQALHRPHQLMASLVGLVIAGGGGRPRGSRLRLRAPVPIRCGPGGEYLQLPDPQINTRFEDSVSAARQDPEPFKGFVADPFGRKVRRRYKAALRGSLGFTAFSSSVAALCSHAIARHTSSATRLADRGRDSAVAEPSHVRRLACGTPVVDGLA